MEKRTFFKSGIVQLDIRSGDLKFNLENAVNGLRDLARQQVDVAVLPEMWSCDFDNPRLEQHALQTPTVIDRLSAAAAEYQMVIAGSLPESAGGSIYNTFYVLDADGSLAGCYRKIHLFTPTREDHFFTAGENAVVCDTSVGRIGLMICYDLRFPELCRTLMDKGAMLVLLCAQWPAARIEHWDILVRARAIENQLFIIAGNRCGRDGRIHFSGHSQIVSPSGDVLAMAGEDSCILSADIETDRIREVREAIPCLQQRVFKAYEV